MLQAYVAVIPIFAGALVTGGIAVDCIRKGKIPRRRNLESQTREFTERSTSPGKFWLQVSAMGVISFALLATGIFVIHAANVSAK